MSGRAGRGRAMRLHVAAALAAALHAGEPPATEAPAPEPAQRLAAPPTVALAALTVPDLTAAATGVLHQDGSADPAALAALLTEINQAVSGRLALAPDRGQEGDEAAGADPLGAPGAWRLWAFWAVDVPACDGLAAALTAVRASGLAHVRPVHLCGLAQWDAWMGRMDEERAALGARAQAQDQAGCDRISAAWRAEVAPFDAMLAGFYRRGVRLLSDAGTAIALHVDEVPSLRLVSPRHRVHALAGFAAGEDLVAWVRDCQAWEAERDARSPSEAPARAAAP
jgi:hypothetical protein